MNRAEVSFGIIGVWKNTVFVRFDLSQYAEFIVSGEFSGKI